MTVKYNYICPNCGNDYSEQRAADEPLFQPRCTNCRDADFVEVSHEIISEEVEREESQGINPMELGLTYKESKDLPVE